MVICNEQDEYEDQDLSLSPRDVSSFIIEGKQGDIDNKEKLKNHLFANIVLATVQTFVKHLDNHNEESIQEIQGISGYGIAITGSGKFGFYKLLMQFGKPMKFVTKIDLRQRPQPSAASLVDYSLDYFFGQQ